MVDSTLFQPLVSLRTRGVVAVEAVGGPDGGDPRATLWTLPDVDQVVRYDVDLAVRAVRQASAQETLLPLHLNITADTVMADPSALALLYGALRQFGRRPPEVMLEIRPCFGLLNRDRLLAGIESCRRRGYKIALDGVGTEEYPLTLVADAAPDLLKIDARVVEALPTGQREISVLDSISRLARGIGARLAAEAVTDPEQLVTLRRYDVTVAQGDLFAPPRRRPATQLHTVATWNALVPGASAPLPLPPVEPLLRDYAHPALALPISATADEVRTAMRDKPAVTGAVLIADDGTPGATLDRNRFLFTVSGTFGHALHAKRSAVRLGDGPRVLPVDARPQDAVHMMNTGDPERVLDDIVLVDDGGRCVGVARAADILRGLAELQAERSAELHPVTGFPGAERLAVLLDGKLAAGELFVLSRIEIAHVPETPDDDFTAGDELLGSLGRMLRRTCAAAPSAQITHLARDRFYVLTDLADVMRFGNSVLDRWRDGTVRRPPLAISSVVSVQSRGTDRRALHEALTEIHDGARDAGGTRWLIRWLGSDRIDVVCDDPEPAPWTLVAQRAG